MDTAKDGTELGRALAQVCAPLGRARALPSALYTDPSTAPEERRRVFWNHWVGVGFAKDLPGPGDARPIDLLGLPLLAVRTRAGDIRVYENVCRHRGMLLIREPTRLRGALCCPYHAWCYDLNGKLIGTPNIGGPGVHSHPLIDRESLGLLPVRSTVWRDVLFVNVSGSAPPFETEHGALIERWREFEGPLYAGGEDSSFTLEVRANWKLAVENYLESYHLPTVHPRLNDYSPLEAHYGIAEYNRFSGQGTRSYSPTLDERGRRFADFPGLTERWHAAAEYVVVFPNVLLGVHRDHAFAIVLEPQGMDRTRERIELYYASEAMQHDAFKDLRTTNARLWRTVFEEDVGVVEGMQRGRHAPHFDGGCLTPVMDEPTHVFHHWVASQWQ